MEIKVKHINNNQTEVSKCLDPFYDAKLLLEGVGVLISEISKWSKTKPKELKEEAWNMERQDVTKKLHDYLDLVAGGYEETSEVVKMTLST